MKKILSMVMVLVAVIGLMVPALASAKDVDIKKAAPVEEILRPEIGTMWVNCENGKSLNVRALPTTSAAVLYRMDCGKELHILDYEDKTWAMVFADGKDVGYVMKKFLQKNKPGKYDITEREDNFKAVDPYEVTALARGKNTEESVGLRVKPNKTSTAIRRLMAGDTLEVFEVGKTWSKVRDLLTGDTGYVANDYITRT